MYSEYCNRDKPLSAKALEVEQRLQQKLREAREAGWLYDDMPLQIAADPYLRSEFERSRTRRSMMESDHYDAEDFVEL